MSQFHLADLFEVVAERIPERIALIDDRGEISFGRMNARSSQLAAALYAHGIRRGDKVGLYLMNGPEYLESFFAVCKIGAVPFNVNYRYKLDELLYLFGNSDAKAVIHHREFDPLVAQLKADLPALTVSIVVDDVDDPATSTSSVSLSYEAELSADHPVPALDRAESDYMLQYSGGTTGMPKGVMWPHKAFFFACLGGGGMYARKPPISLPDEQADIAEGGFPIRVMPVAPLMHGAAIWTALSAVLGGITLVLDPMRSGFDAEAIWDRVEAKHVNILQIVGDAMAVPLLQVLKDNPARWDLSRLIHFGSGGAVFSRHIKDELSKFLPNTMMGDGMGTSETGISGMGEPVKDGGFIRLPSNEVQRVVFDTEFAEVGETGFLARTGHIPIGYYNDPEKSAEVFKTIDDQVWAVSGDQARLDDDGMITIFGRGSTCINTGGEKVYPEEVEEVMRAHPDVADAVVVGLPDPKWGQAVAALISLLDKENAPNPDQIIDFCKDRLAGYKVPKHIKIMDVVKRSVAGKQDYKWAKAQFESEA